MQITTSGFKVTVLAQTLTINGEDRNVAQVSTAVGKSQETYLYLLRDGSLDRRPSAGGAGYLAARITSDDTGITAASSSDGEIFVATTDATPTLIADTELAYSVGPNSVSVFEGYVTSIQDDGSTANVYAIRAVVRQGANAAATALVGTALITAYEDTAGADCTVAANTTLGSIAITVTGAIGDNLTWKSTVKKVAQLSA